MMNLTDRAVLRALQRRHGFRTKKQLGQNFLVDAGAIDRIVDGSGVGPSDVVVEIGPGMGVLTGALASRAGRVLAVEIDRALAPVLAETVPFDNVEVVFADVLGLSLDALVREQTGADTYHVVANLPYYITTPIIMKLLEDERGAKTITVMTQKEVARRMQATPGGKEYGALSVAVQYHAQVQTVTQVSRTSFDPPPNVDSTVVRLVRRAHKAVSVDDEGLFFSVVRGAFMRRRKTLLNALTHALALWDKEGWQEVLRAAGIDPSRRGETLSLQEFAAICEASDTKKKAIDNGRRIK